MLIWAKVSKAVLYVHYFYSDIRGLSERPQHIEWTHPSEDDPLISPADLEQDSGEHS